MCVITCPLHAIEDANGLQENSKFQLSACYSNQKNSWFTSMNIIIRHISRFESMFLFQSRRGKKVDHQFGIGAIAMGRPARALVWSLTRDLGCLHRRLQHTAKGSENRCSIDAPTGLRCFHNITTKLRYLHNIRHADLANMGFGLHAINISHFEIQWLPPSSDLELESANHISTVLTTRPRLQYRKQRLHGILPLRNMPLYV